MHDRLAVKWRIGGSVDERDYPIRVGERDYPNADVTAEQ